VKTINQLIDSNDDHQLSVLLFPPVSQL